MWVATLLGGLVLTGRMDLRIYALFDVNSHNLHEFEKLKGVEGHGKE